MPELADRLTAALADRYRIERELGAGGMATVYLAEDLRHHRRVAVKVLHADLAAALGAERFLHEIRTTANLQHPHILPLHDSGAARSPGDAGEGGGASFLYYVMPYVAGETLRHRLERETQLPLDDAVRIAREVAGALDYAHRQGVIHRDIKPENILLHEGQALVADFGIALAVQQAGGQRMTQTGLSLGTPHYMSPEQAMGERTVDARSDVYALGAVLYEMLVGEPPFSGPTVQAIVAKVMSERPTALRMLRDTVPPHVEAAVLAALAKLPADRFASAAAFAEALRTGTAQPATAAWATVPRTATVGWKRLSLGLGAVVAVLTVALAASVRRAPDRTGVPRPVLRFEVAIPDSLDVEDVTLTPDGARLLIETDGRPYVYSFADMRLAPLEVRGLTGRLSLGVSPDGEWLSFVEGGLLKVVPFRGGATRTLADSVLYADWGDDGFVYATRRAGGRYRLVRAPVAGGALDELLVAPDSSSTIGGIPLPNGKGFAYATGNNVQARVDGVWLLDLESRRSTRIVVDGLVDATPMGFTATGHLLFYAADGLHAVGFDPDRRVVTSAPVRIVAGLPLGASFNAGMLAYNMTPPAGPALADRRGVQRELPGAVGPNSWAFEPKVSPNGRALAFWRYESPANRWDVWSYQLPSGPLTRLTDDSLGVNRSPAWAPDGEHVWFLAQHNGRMGVFSVAWDGSRPAVPLLSRPGDVVRVAALPDGQRAVLQEQGRGLVLVSLASPDSAITLVDAAQQPSHPAVSPDGRWLAYSAVAVGTREIFVRPLDAGTARWKVSRSGGEFPVWSRGGRELFFHANDSVHAAAITREPTFSAGAVRALFRVAGIGYVAAFDVLPGDSLFVASRRSATDRQQVVVVANFLEELRALAGERGRGGPR